MGCKPGQTVNRLTEICRLNFYLSNLKKMQLKLEAAGRFGYDKAITFEFSHFMSPQSMYPSAHNLYNRYLEFKQTLSW